MHRPKLRDVPLLPVLSVLRPTPAETQWLRACLHRGEAGRRAWQDLAAPAGPPPRPESSLPRGLLPLLLATLEENGVAAERDLVSRVKVAYCREALRAEAYQRVGRDVLERLASCGVPALVGKGAALACTVYEDAALRHCHDLDLLVPRDQLRRAADALESTGLRPATAGAAGHGVRLLHESGLPVELHTAWFRLPQHGVPLSELFARSGERPVFGVTGRVPSPSDLLMHVCGHAATSGSRDSLRWVCDAGWLLARGGIDWDAFVETTARARLALPMLASLSYLTEELRAPVPDTVIERLGDVAARSTRRDGEAALTGARAGRRATLRALLGGTTSWRDRVAVLRWVLCPSAECLAWTEGSAPARRRPWLYVRRLARPLGRGLRQALSGRSA